MKKNVRHFQVFENIHQKKNFIFIYLKCTLLDKILVDGCVEFKSNTINHFLIRHLSKIKW